MRALTMLGSSLFFMTGFLTIPLHMLSACRGRLSGFFAKLGVACWGRLGTVPRKLSPVAYRGRRGCRTLEAASIACRRRSGCLAWEALPLCTVDILVSSAGSFCDIFTVDDRAAGAEIHRLG